jgi:hypothetical protein
MVTALHNMAVGRGTGLCELTACEVSYKQRDSRWHNKLRGKARPEVAANLREGATEGNFSRESYGKSKSNISVDLFVRLL